MPWGREHSPVCQCFGAAGRCSAAHAFGHTYPMLSLRDCLMSGSVISLAVLSVRRHAAWGRGVEAYRALEDSRNPQGKPTHLVTWLSQDMQAAIFVVLH